MRALQAITSINYSLVPTLYRNNVRTCIRTGVPSKAQVAGGFTFWTLDDLDISVSHLSIL